MIRLIALTYIFARMIASSISSFFSAHFLTAIDRLLFKDSSVMTNAPLGVFSKSLMLLLPAGIDNVSTCLNIFVMNWRSGPPSSTAVSSSFWPKEEKGRRVYDNVSSRVGPRSYESNQLIP